MFKKKMVYVLILCLTLGGCVVPVKRVSAASFSVNAFTKGGRVTNITSKKLVLRRQTGSSPESWGKPQKYKVTAATKFYRSNLEKILHRNPFRVSAFFLCMI